MNYLLALQLKGDSRKDYNELIELEDAVTLALGDAGSVDSHDIGSNERNLFIATKNPQFTLETLKPVLSSLGLLSTITAGYRKNEDAAYTPLYPADLKQFSVI